MHGDELKATKQLYHIMIFFNNYSERIQDGYSSPECRIIGLKFEGMLCQSNFGESGQAGKGFNSGNTTEYGTDF